MEDKRILKAFVYDLCVYLSSVVFVAGDISCTVWGGSEKGLK